MSDYISRHDAIEEIRKAENHAFNSFYKGLVKAHKIVADLPPADVVEVVRCRDCKHCYFADNRVPDEQGWVCEINSSEPVNLNGFCSYGERKE